MSRVFMLAPSDRIDVRRASRYGEITYLYDRGEQRASIWDPMYVVEAIDRMRDMGYDPRRDYVLVAGSTAPLVMFTAALATRYKNPAALFYDLPTGEYVVKSLGLIHSVHIDKEHVTYEPGTVPTVRPDASPARAGS